MRVTEEELASRAVAPRVSQADVDAEVRNAYFHVIPDSMMTICALTLQNGFTVLGKSACADPRNFQKDIGERIAREEAYGKVWALLGFRLADRLHAETQPGALYVLKDGAMMIGTERDKLEFIARVCHEVNRAYCVALGDNTQRSWKDAPEWQRESARMGADLHMMGDFGPEASHISWLKEKDHTGWKYGPVKDEAKKEHPCMVAFDQLPREQQAKDFIFRGVVHALK